MYKMENQIRYSECGPDNRLKLSAIINYFQDCSSEHSKRLGMGVDYLKEKKRAWILNTWQVEVYRYPAMSELVEVSTWANGCKGVFGPRSFCMKTVEGEMLACANTLWVYIDTETGKPIKPTAEEIAAYGGEPALDMEKVPRKIMIPEEAGEVDTFPIRKYHIDTNHHVNNSKYIELAAEVIPEDFRVAKLQVEYRKAAVYGDKIVLKCMAEEESIIVGLCDEDGNPYAIAKFIGEHER